MAVPVLGGEDHLAACESAEQHPAFWRVDRVDPQGSEIPCRGLSGLDVLTEPTSARRVRIESPPQQNHRRGDGSCAGECHGRACPVPPRRREVVGVGVPSGRGIGAGAEPPRGTKPDVEPASNLCAGEARPAVDGKSHADDRGAAGDEHGVGARRRWT